MELKRKLDLIVLYQVCVFFGPIGKPRWPPGFCLAETFWLLLWKHWKEFNETWQENRSQRRLRRWCFLGCSENQDGRPASHWLRHFWLLLWNRVNDYQRNLTGSKISTICTKLGPIGKQRWTWPLIGRDIADVFYVTAEMNSTKLDRKLDIVPYQVCVLRPIGKPRWPSGLWLTETFSNFSSETAEWNSTKIGRKHDLNVLNQVCVLTGRSEKQDGRAAFDLPNYFQRLYWKCCTDFDETWQVARSQRPLISILLVYLSRRRKCTIVIMRCMSVHLSSLRPSVVRRR